MPQGSHTKPDTATEDAPVEDMVPLSLVVRDAEEARRRGDLRVAVVFYERARSLFRFGGFVEGRCHNCSTLTFEVESESGGEKRHYGEDLRVHRCGR